MVSQLSRADGYLYGDWTRPHNLAANSAGSIPEETTARQYCMRGGLGRDAAPARVWVGAAGVLGGEGHPPGRGWGSTGRPGHAELPGGSSRRMGRGGGALKACTT